MSFGPLCNWEDRLRRAIDRRNLPVSVQDFQAVLADLGRQSTPLNHRARDFVTTHAGLTAEDLSQQSFNEANLEIAANRYASAQEVRRNALNTREAAAVLGMTPANVRRSARNGTLYSHKTSPGGQHLLPKWQFKYERPLPGLHTVISSLPSNYHPLEVEAFMTEHSCTLGGTSPLDWLAENGNIDAVVTLADERTWE